MSAASIPVFPLHAVLFPGGLLKLRIFETRYLDMISRCMREDAGFGVVLIVEGREAGGPARTVEIGTLARIVDFEQLEGGLLGITARGEQRFRVLATHLQSDGLNVAEVEWLASEPAAAVPPQHAIVTKLLQHAFEQLGRVYADTAAHYDDAGWVGMRLAEVLPLHPAERQELLELNDPVERLKRLHGRIDIAGES